MKVFSIEMRLCATAYIKAEKAEDVMAIANSLYGLSLTTENTGDEGQIKFSGQRLDDPALPAISFSPVMTIHEPFLGEVDTPVEEH